MALVITDTGKELALGYLIGRTTSTQGLTLKLYTNNVAPSVSTTNEGLTYLASGSGYAPVNLTPSSWVVDGSSAAYPQQTWTFTGPVGNVYGYAVTTQSSNILVMAEKFSDGPYNILSSGDIIRVTLSISLN